MRNRPSSKLSLVIRVNKYALCLLVLVVVATSLQRSYRPSPTTGAPAQLASSSRSLRAENPRSTYETVISVTAKELAESLYFGQEAIEKEKSYSGQVMQVSGAIDFVGVVDKDTVHVELKTPYREVMFVWCDVENPTGAALELGNNITLQGRFIAFDGPGIQLKDCELVATVE